jgi:hypothetical protein
VEPMALSWVVEKVAMSVVEREATSVVLSALI